MLDGLCRRLKPRRGQPLINVGGGVQLAYFLEQPVLLGTVWELGDLRFQPGLLGCNSIFKCMGNGPATLHDTTSCLRVLAVGFADAILICRRPAICSEVNTVELVAAKSTWNDRGHAVPASGRASRSYEMKEAANRSGLQLIGLRSFLIILRWSLPYSSATCRAWSVRVGLSFGSSSGSLLLLHDLVTGLLTLALPINLNSASGSGLSGTGRDSKQATVIFSNQATGVGNRPVPEFQSPRLAIRTGCTSR